MFKAGPDATYAAELISFIVRLSHSAGRDHGLADAQLLALRYFARATRTSRTVTAFADYHVTTRGTASQTVKSLLEKGLLERTRSQTDRRSAQIDLTSKGRALCEADLYGTLVQAITRLTETQQLDLTAILEPLVDQIAADQQKRHFGICSACLHLKECMESGDEGTAYFCRIANEPLSRLNLKAICMDYEAATNQV